MLKGIQATFSDWDTSPTALNLTNEDFSDDNATIGIKTAGAYTTLGTIIFDLGAEYTNVLINGGGIISAENAVFINLSCSADGITYDAYFPVYDAGDSGNHDFGFRWHSLDGRYIKIIFTSGANPASTLFTITFYGFAAMQYK